MKKFQQGLRFLATLSAMALVVPACTVDLDPEGEGDSGVEICNDGQDNDGDGKVDCQDQDCAANAACQEATDTDTEAATDTDTDSDEKTDDDEPVDLCEGNTCAEEGKTCNKVDGECYGADEDKCADKTCTAAYTTCDMATGECVCINDYVDEGAGCIHSKQVECDDSSVPQSGAIKTEQNVTVTYTTGKGWSKAASCLFTCDEEGGYTMVGDTCVVSDDDSECPNDANGKEQHRENGECVRNIIFANGNAGAVVLESVTGAPGEAITVSGTFTTQTAYPADYRNKDGRCPGVLAKLCYEKDGEAGMASSFEDLTCIDASYTGETTNGYKNDVYSAAITYRTAGEYLVYYRWSGDGGATWYYSDLEKVRSSWQEAVKNSAYAATATIAEREVIDGLSYHMDFDLLGKTQGKWVDNTTIPGWYITSYNANKAKNEDATENDIWNLTATGATDTNYYSSYGSKLQPGLLNLGSQNATDRALGTCASNSYQDTLYLLLQNPADKTLSKITVSYTGEEWRNGANKAAGTEGILQFSYAVVGSVPANMNAFRDNTDAFKGTTEVAALHFNAPVAGGDAKELDGNAAANRVEISGSFNVKVPAGSYLLLKWFDPREVGENSMLGIDDLTVIGE